MSQSFSLDEMIETIKHGRRLDRAVNQAIRELRDAPTLTASIVADHAARILHVGADDALRDIAAEKLAKRFGVRARMPRRRLSPR